MEISEDLSKLLSGWCIFEKQHTYLIDNKLWNRKFLRLSTFKQNIALYEIRRKQSKIYLYHTNFQGIKLKIRYA